MVKYTSGKNAEQVLEWGETAAVAESERLVFRRIVRGDFSELCKMLKDPDVMYAWEHAFTDEEVQDWIDRRIAGYEKYGYDYFLAKDRKTGETVGQIGLLNECIDGCHYTGIGYMLLKNFWHKGYASEGAGAMLNYAFNVLRKNEVIAEIRPENSASRKVAERLGMTEAGSFIKNYNGKDMPHLIYVKRRKE